MENPSAAWRYKAIVKLSAVFLGENRCDNIASMSETWFSTERQRLLALHLAKCNGSAATLSHNRSISGLSRHTWFRRHCHRALKMSINRASTIVGLASWKIKGLCDYIDPQSNNRLPFYATMLTRGPLQCAKLRVNGGVTTFDLAFWITERQWNADNPQWTYRHPLLGKVLVTISCPPLTIERPQNINSFWGGSERYTAMNCIVLFLNAVLRGLSLQSDLVYNCTNMHAMTYRSDFLLVPVGSLLKSPQSALLYCYFRQAFESDYPTFWFLPPCQIQNLSAPHCLRLWSLPKMNLALFGIWATILYKSSSMFGGLQ